MAEREQIFELGDQDVVETGDAAEHKEQYKHEHTQVGHVVSVSGLIIARYRIC